MKVSIALSTTSEEFKHLQEGDIVCVRPSGWQWGTDANGNTVILKDDSATTAYSVNAALTDNSTTTTRLRMA